MRGLVIVSLLGMAAAPAFAEDTFEAAAAGAQRIKRVDDLVWALTAACDAGSDTQQRQCRRIRDTRLGELASATLLIEGEREAFVVGPWSAQKKSATLTLSACIRCTGVDVGGKSWLVSGTRPAGEPPRFQAGRLVTAPLSDTTRTFADDAAAKKYAASVANSKVQFLVKLPASPKWSDSGRQGIAFDVVAYRVYSPCDGSVVVSSPKSGPGDIDKRACAGIPASGEVDQLTPAMIKESMKPVLDAAQDCYAKHQVAGKGKLKISIGADGNVSESSVEGELGQTETGKCIGEAAKKAAFPKSKKPKTSCAIPLSLP